MNLNELIINIRKVSSEKNVQLFAEFIQNWKINEKNIVELGTPSSFNKVQGELIGYLKNK